MGMRGVRGAVAAVAALTLTATGCTAVTEPRPTTSPGDELPGLTAAVERLPDRVAELLAETGVPGLAVAVVHEDAVVFAEGFGIADLDSGAAVDADTLFALASVSKPVGASVISALIGRGEVTWETPVRARTPGFALADGWVSEHLTIGDLYSHRSGLPDHAGDDLASLGLDRATVLERLRYLPLHPFRVTYAYTNFGIQAAADAAAGEGEWSALSDELLYTPLGMQRTTSRYAEFAADPNRAVGHTRRDGVWEVTPQQLDDDIATAAGGVASSAAEMARWVRMLLAGGSFDGREIVDPAALATAMVPQMPMPMDPVDPAAARGAYGFGFQIGTMDPGGRTLVSHSGAFAQGAGTMVALLPALEIGVVVLTNGFPMGLAETVAMEFLDLAQHGEPTRDWWADYSAAFAGLAADFPSAVAGDPPADAAAPPDAAVLVGSYQNDYFGRAVVAAEAGVLTLTLDAGGGAGQSWVLEPWDGDVFRVLIDNEDASAGSVSAVTVDGARLVFEFFDVSSGGAGTFIRVP